MPSLVGSEMCIRDRYHFDYFYLGLSYEYPVGDIWNYTYGNTQIVIGVNLGRGKNRFGDTRYW